MNSKLKKQTPNFLENVSKWIESLQNQKQQVPADVLAIAEKQITTMKQRLPQMARALAHPFDEESFYSYSHLRERVLESAYFDWDDVSFIGHPGHSSVLIPLCEKHLNFSLTQDQILTATVIGNEIISRLGASIFFGPQNGQTLSFPHQVATVAMIGYLRKWSKDKILRTMGVALSQPHFSLFPAFFSYAKSTIAWFPICTALEAIEVEPFLDEGLPSNLINGRFSLLTYFSNLPAPFFLDGLGQSWLTYTVQIKPIPGCAYIIGPAVEWIKKFKNSKTSKFEAAEIQEIRIGTSVFGLGVEAMMRNFISNSQKLSPHEVSFSIPLTLALAIKFGDVTVEHLKPESLEKHEDELRKLASKIVLEHDWDLTLSFMQELDQQLNLRTVFKGKRFLELLQLYFFMKKYSSGFFNLKKIFFDKSFYHFLKKLIIAPKLTTKINLSWSAIFDYDLKGFSWNLSPCRIFVRFSKDPQVITFGSNFTEDSH